MKLFSSLAEISDEPSLLGYMRVLQRAWESKEGFGLSGVLCVEGVPTLYRKNSDTALTPGEVHELHRRFWNQSVASVLLVIDPKTVYLISGLQPPLRDQTPFESILSPVVKCWEKNHFGEAQAEQLFESIQNGEFYRRYNTKFKSTGAVDQYLTRNLLGLRDCLTPVLHGKAHDFICRLLFACYLVDRKIVPLRDTKCERLHEALNERGDEDALVYLYKLFDAQRRTFNGSMFDQDLDAERVLLTSQHMQEIKGFLRGDPVRGQDRTLGFWAYDFKLIPIETISSIYEQFLGREDRAQRGAHYTPRFLAELALDVTCETLDSWEKLRYLDPSCGSGIFLVTLFNRLVTRWELNHKDLVGKPAYYERKEQALRQILNHQIRGMDIKEAACVLACFSLYVAFLDAFDPCDIKTYIEKTGYNRLPRLLLKSNGRDTGENTIPVVMHGDSLESERLRKQKYDVLIGNPPWGGVGRGSKEIALKFIALADDLLETNGLACLLLPSKIYLNIRTNPYQAKWLDLHTVERVLQLADFRRILFPNAKCATMVLRFRPGKPQDGRHQILYDTPKFEPSARRQGLVLITAADRKAIPQARLVDAARNGFAHVLWKRLLWGTGRDERMLSYLDSFAKIEDRESPPANQHRWSMGQGFIPATTARIQKPSRPWWSGTCLFLEANAKCLNCSNFIFEDDVRPIGNRFERIERGREGNQSIFKSPMVLISQGFGKVVFCDFPVLFQDSLQSIHGPPEDEDLLLFLSAYLRSDLAKYYLFHTSSKLGIERDVVRWEEALKLPFPMPEDAPSKKASAIVRIVAGLLRASRDRVLAKRDALDNDDWLTLRAKEANGLLPKTNAMVNEYFGLLDNERWLVDDTVNVYWDSATPASADEISIPTLLPVDQAGNVRGYETGLRAYADALTSTLNSWASAQNSSWRVTADGGVDAESGLAMVTLTLGKSERDFVTSPLIHKVWRKILRQSGTRQVTLSLQRQIFAFEGDSFRILRPASLMHWTRTAALNDADDIFSQIKLMGGRRK
ncbi:MAG: N-6 DNA methylase [Verrucomicrobia bacterium]|nr:N-6 DNA methylase [Verrucomicrobiota bacterium]